MDTLLRHVYTQWPYHPVETNHSQLWLNTGNFSTISFLVVLFLGLGHFLSCLPRPVSPKASRPLLCRSLFHRILACQWQVPCPPWTAIPLSSTPKEWQALSGFSLHLGSLKLPLDSQLMQPRVCFVSSLYIRFYCCELVGQWQGKERVESLNTSSLASLLLGLTGLLLKVLKLQF